MSHHPIYGVFSGSGGPFEVHLHFLRFGTSTALRCKVHFLNKNGACSGIKNGAPFLPHVSEDSKWNNFNTKWSSVPCSVTPFYLIMVPFCVCTQGENRNGAKTSMFLDKNGAHSKKWSSIPIFSCIRTQNWSFIANVVLHFHTSPICFFMHTPFLIPEHVPFLILGCTYFGPPEPENTPYFALSLLPPSLCIFFIYFSFFIFLFLFEKGYLF